MAVRAGAIKLNVNAIRRAIFELLLMEAHNNLEGIGERTKLASHFTGYISCAPSQVFTIITDLRVCHAAHFAAHFAAHLHTYFVNS